MKEKIGMEKLIELLNEYEKEIKKSEFYEWEKGVGGDTNLFRRDTRDEEGSHLYSDTADTYVISKKYGFIGWLVENEKIDLDKAKILESGNKAELFEFIDRAGYMKIRNRSYFSEYKQLLMLLSIKDEPIRFLCEILK